MADNLSPEQRHQTMTAIRQKDTGPELIVRRAAHALGFRYRLHQAKLPGRPDLVFPGLGKVIFVHGCFWHRHDCRNGRAKPAANRSYWLSKFRRNAARDRRNLDELDQSGWKVMILWECEVRSWSSKQLGFKLKRFLEKM